MTTATQLSLSRDALLKPLQMVIGVVERKQTLPILSNVLLRIRGNQLSMAGTDLEVELRGQFTLDNEFDDFDVTIPGRKLLDITKALPDGANIHLELDAKKLILKSGRSRFNLQTLPAQDFPLIDEQSGVMDFQIPQSVLGELLQQTAFSMAQQDVRYYLNGMLFEMSKNLLRTVATDGHRLAMTQLAIQMELDHRLQIIVPRKGVLELMRLLHDDDTPVRVIVGQNHVQVMAEEYTFTSKLLEGRFPDFQRVIPKKSDKHILLDVAEFKQALTRAAILCNEKFRGVQFNLANNVLTIDAHNPEQESAQEQLNVPYAHDALSIGFNVTYLLDILNTLDSKQVRLHFTNADSSVLLEANEEKTADATYVIMPMRI